MRRWLLCSVALHASLAFLLLTGAWLVPGRGPAARPVLAEVELVEQNTPAVGSRAADGPVAKPLAEPAQPIPPAPAPSPARPTVPPASSGRIGEPGSTGTGLVSGRHVMPAALDKTVRNVPPAYPRQAVVEGEQGSVILKVHIAADGTATAVDIFRTSRYGLLDKAAEAAVGHWHFIPARESGVAVPSTMLVKIRFVLTNPEGGQ